MTDPDTRDGSFPATHLSLLGRIADPDPCRRGRALETFLALYRDPAYVHLRRRHRLSPEDAADVVQAFFTEQVLEREGLRGFEPARGRFRSYLRVALDRFCLRWRRDGRALKRGAGEVHSFDPARAEAELGLASGDDDFERIGRRLELDAALALLESEPGYRALWLRVHDWSHRQVGTALGIHRGSVPRLVERAHQALVALIRDPWEALR